MKIEDLCTDNQVVIEKLPLEKQIYVLHPWHLPRPTGVKRIRMVCSKCKRRLWSSVEYHHDGDEVVHRMPPHKPKKWWKKRKEKKRVGRS